MAALVILKTGRGRSKPTEGDSGSHETVHEGMPIYTIDAGKDLERSRIKEYNWRGM